MFKRIVSTMTATFMFAAGMSIAGATPAAAVSIADGSTVSLVSADPTLAPCGQGGYLRITSTTRVRTWNQGDNAYDFSAISTASFIWDASAQSTYNSVLARVNTTRTTFTPVTGTTYTFYRLKEGSTNANYFCHAGQIELLLNGSDSITGWVVSPTTFFTAGESSGSSSSSSSQQAAAQAAAQLARAIALGKSVLATQFSNNKPATVEQFLAAGYGVRNNNVAEKASAAIMKLTFTERENSQKVNEIINLENFIDRVAVADTRSTVGSTELVSRGLLPADSAHKHSVVQGLASYPNGSLDSLEKIAAAVKEQIYKAEAPKRRLAEIKAKIAARNK